MTGTVVLLPSPFLGSASWGPVATRLPGSVVLGTPVAMPAEILGAWRAQLPPGPLTLVAHSNAGLYVPAIASGRDAAEPVERAVFVDAAVAVSDPTPMAPPALAAQVLAGATDDRLPRWTDWWPPLELDAALADVPEPSRSALLAGVPRLPRGYLTDTLPAPAVSGLPGRYVAFGSTYADETAVVEEWGWPVTRLDGGHLHLLVDPDEVAAVIDATRR